MALKGHGPGRSGNHHPHPSRQPRPLPAPPPAIFRGWLVVAGAFLVLMVGYGAVYSYAAFADEIMAEFGSSRASISFIFSLSGGVALFVSAVSGPLADRIGPRLLATLGMLTVGLGLMVAAKAGNMLQVYLGYGLLIGIGVGLAYVPAVATVQRWFVIRRGLASGIAVSGIGIGTAMIAPTTDLLSAFGDWHTTFLACAAMAIMVGVAGALMLDSSPTRHGLLPDGQPLPIDQPTPPAHPPPPPLRAVIGTPGLALAYAGTLLVGLSISTPYALLVGTAQDLNIIRHDALSLLTLIGSGSVFGRFLLASLADVLGRRRTILWCCGGVSATTLLWAGAEEMLMFQVFAFTFGAFQGGFIALLPAFVADSFGTRAIGSTLGLLYTSRGIAMFTGPPALTAAIAASGSHAFPVSVLAAIAAAGALFLAAVRQRGIATERLIDLDMQAPATPGMEPSRPLAVPAAPIARQGMGD